MTLDLLQIFNETVGAPYAEEAGQGFPATRHQTAQALHMILPALNHNITQKAHSEAGARALLDFLRDARIDQSFADRLSAVREVGAYDRLKENGAYILKYLLGDRLSKLIDHVSDHSELTIGAISELTKITAAILVSALAKHVTQQEIDAASLRTALIANKEVIGKQLTDELRSVLGIPDTAETKSQPDADMVIASGPEPSPVAKVLPWLTLLITSLALLYFVDRGCGEATVPDTPAPDDTEKTNVTEQESQIVTLPDSTRIMTHKGSFAERLASALKGGEDNGGGYILDAVWFENGGPTLLPASYPQLDRLVSVLQAFEGTRIRLEGHNYDGSDPTEQLRLSNQRARSVMSYLVNNGVAGERLRAIGRGSSKPVVSSQSQVAKPANDRIEVIVERN